MRARAQLVECAEYQRYLRVYVESVDNVVRYHRLTSLKLVKIGDSLLV